MLRSLLDLSEALRSRDDSLITPLGYRNVAIRWIVPLDAAGELRRPPYHTSDGEDGARRFTAPDRVRTVGIKPKLLADNGEYTFGIGRDPNDAKVAKRHAAYLDLLRACVEATGSTVGAVLRFLESFDHEALGFDEDYDPSELVTFEVDGRLAFQDSAIESFWAEAVIADPGGPRGTDLLTGESGLLMATEPTKVKGIPGGQTAGTNLVSANSEAFLSYGATQSLIAPILVRNADRYAKALNHLLGKEEHHLRLGSDLVYAFWTDTGWVPPVRDVLTGRGDEAFEALFADADPPRSLSIEPDPEDVGRLLKTVWTGRAPDSASHDEAFHAVALSASGARVIVRGQVDTTVEQVRASLRAFVANSAMVARDGRRGEPAGAFALAASIYRDARKQMVGAVPSTIVRHALTREPLPASLLDAVARRNRADRDVTRPRAMLARLVLTSMEVDMNDIDRQSPDRPEASYHLGRLLAVLDALQYDALGQVNATIVDRYYGSFSTAPASILGRLLQSSRDYVAKIRSKRGAGAGLHAERRLSDVLSRIEDVPDTLDSREQALFGLGYYHERAAHWKAIADRKEAREQEAQA